MGFQPVILWTDALIYLLLLLTAVAVWYTRLHPHLSQPWKRVARSRTGQAAMVILLLLGAGFYSEPWLELIEQSAQALSSDFPQTPDVEEQGL